MDAAPVTFSPALLRAIAASFASGEINWAGDPADLDRPLTDFLKIGDGQKIRIDQSGVCAKTEGGPNG